MISKEDEYDADTLKIAGFAMTAPFGKLILDLPDLLLSGLNTLFICYIGFVFILLCVGIVIIEIGSKILEGNNAKRE